MIIHSNTEVLGMTIKLLEIYAVNFLSERSGRMQVQENKVKFKKSKQFLVNILNILNLYPYCFLLFLKLSTSGKFKKVQQRRR